MNNLNKADLSAASKDVQVAAGHVVVPHTADGAFTAESRERHSYIFGFRGIGQIRSYRMRQAVQLLYRVHARKRYVLTRRYAAATLRPLRPRNLTFTSLKTGMAYQGEGDGKAEPVQPVAAAPRFRRHSPAAEHGGSAVASLKSISRCTPLCRVYQDKSGQQNTAQEVAEGAGLQRLKDEVCGAAGFTVAS